MKRRVSRRAVAQKQTSLAKKRSIVTPDLDRKQGSFYEKIKMRGGDCQACVIRSVGGIGDMLMATPLLRQLKREFPKLHLVFAIDRHRTQNDIYYHLLKNAPFINEFIDARYIDRSKYAAVIDISAVCIRYERKGLPLVNRIDLFARACGVVRLKSKMPFYYVEPQERQWAKVKIKPYRDMNKTLVALHTASFDGKRSWPPANYRKLIEHTAKHNLDIHFIVFDFNGVLKDIDNKSNCIRLDTTIREMAALIEQCDLFIGPDSGPMHIAGALGTRSLVLFGSVPPQARINYYESHTALTVSLPCLGCWYEACDIGIKCMSDLSHIVVFNGLLDRI
jgi:ADP-heptose:LPS heptosyltransferase